MKRVRVAKRYGYRRADGRTMTISVALTPDEYRGLKDKAQSDMVSMADVLRKSGIPK